MVLAPLTERISSHPVTARGANVTVTVRSVSGIDVLARSSPLHEHRDKQLILRCAVGELIH
jgi:hypothetical protein